MKQAEFFQIGVVLAFVMIPAMRPKINKNHDITLKSLAIGGDSGYTWAHFSPGGGTRTPAFVTGIRFCPDHYSKVFR